MKVWLKSIPNTSTLIKLIIGLVILSSFFYINAVEMDPDLGWHLRVGQNISEYHQIPRTDQFSFTMSGHSWVDHEWLTNTLLWLAATNDLWWLVVLFFTFLATTPFFFWLKRSKSVFLVSFVLFCALPLIELNILGVRPQILSFFLFWFAFEILFLRYNERQTQNKRKKILFFLPPLFLLWANLHAGFIAGLALFAFFIFGRAWQNYKNKNAADQNFELIIFTLCSLTTLLNPYGPGLHIEILNVIIPGTTARFIAEWQSPFYFSSVYLYLILSIILFVIIKNWKKYFLGIFLTAIVFLLTFLKSLRLFLFFLAASIPMVISGAQFIKKDILEARQQKPFSPKERSLFKMAGFVLLALVLVFFSCELSNFRSFTVPKDATVFLKKYLSESNRAHRILNDYAWGGYLLWQIPDFKVFIDGRMPHWQDKQGNSAMKDYAIVFGTKSENDWQEILKKWQITEIIMPNPDADSKQTITKNWLGIKIKNYFLSSAAINQFLSPAQTRDKRKIIKNTLQNIGWQVIYEDNIAIIIQNQDQITTSSAIDK